MSERRFVAAALASAGLDIPDEGKTLWTPHGLQPLLVQLLERRDLALDERQDRNLQPCAIPKPLDAYERYLTQFLALRARLGSPKPLPPMLRLPVSPVTYRDLICAWALVLGVRTYLQPDTLRLWTQLVPAVCNDFRADDGSLDDACATHLHYQLKKRVRSIHSALRHIQVPGQASKVPGLPIESPVSAVDVDKVGSSLGLKPLGGQAPGLKSETELAASWAGAGAHAHDESALLTAADEAAERVRRATLGTWWVPMADLAPTYITHRLPNTQPVYASTWLQGEPWRSMLLLWALLAKIVPLTPDETVRARHTFFDESGKKAIHRSDYLTSAFTPKLFWMGESLVDLGLADSVDLGLPHSAQRQHSGKLPYTKARQWLRAILDARPAEPLPSREHMVRSALAYLEGFRQVLVSGPAGLPLRPLSHVVPRVVHEHLSSPQALAHFEQKLTEARLLAASVADAHRIRSEGMYV